MLVVIGIPTGDPDFVKRSLAFAYGDDNEALVAGDSCSGDFVLRLAYCSSDTADVVSYMQLSEWC